MITTRIKIGDGPVQDFYEAWGFIYMDADERTEAPVKSFEKSAYAEEPGEHIDPRTVQDAFDYTATFLLECPNRDFVNANSRIAAFNKALYTADAASGVRTYKTVTFYNDHNRVKIVGVPEPVAEPKSFFRRQDGSVMDCAEVTLKLRVERPDLCDFDLQQGGK